MVIFWLHRIERRLSELFRRSPGCAATSPGTRELCVTDPMFLIPSPCPRRGLGRGCLLIFMICSESLCLSQIKRNLFRRSPGLAATSPRTGRGRKAHHVGAVGAILATAAALAGCAAGTDSPPTVRPLMVQVPVLHEIPCPVPALTPPALPIAGLKAGSSPADTMRAYAAAVSILKGAVRERDAVLAGCAGANQPTQTQAENTQ